jgi:RING-variant domain
VTRVACLARNYSRTAAHLSPQATAATRSPAQKLVGVELTAVAAAIGRQGYSSAASSRQGQHLWGCISAMECASTGAPVSAHNAAAQECWICLGTAKGALTQPCSCPGFAHRACLARWQLQKAGTRCEPSWARRPMSNRAPLSGVSTLPSLRPRHTAEYLICKAYISRLRSASPHCLALDGLARPTSRVGV